ncbi:MAG: shikimate kinase AroK [Gammaproteobacteria bacterium]|nr:shikimate kinase AroK [Gammaproteobacteria bacterium]
MGNHTKNIFLIGPMGAGKTTMGRQLAKRLNLEFLDSDHAIEQHTGADIPLIFEKEGETGFRKREESIIDELTRKNGLVLATGGGAVISAENRKHLKERGTVIYLHSDIKHLIDRTRHDKNRPLLQTADPAAKLRELMKIREPLYRETADIIINTGEKSIRSVITVILDKLKAYQNENNR